MPVGGERFSSVRRAREALKERANEILTNYLKLLNDAHKAGDFETASKGYQYLMDHLPADEGVRLLDHSVDKQLEAAKGPTGPQIYIAGITLGGLPQAASGAPTVEVIDVTPTVPQLPPKPTDEL